MSSPFPSISAVTPSSGPVSGGTPVTIDGQNFAANCQVKFEGTVAAILSSSPARLIVTSPPGAAGPATIRVINPNQPPAIAQNAFMYLVAPPAPPPPPVMISGVSPLSGPVSGGTQVTIDGQNFAPNCQVKFEGTVAAILSSSPLRLIVSTPPGAAGPATIRVINPNQPPAIAQNAFMYLVAPPAPPPPPPPPVMISGVSPLSGPVSGGTQVTIDGQSFAPNCQVKFEGTVAAILSSSPARLIVTSPPGAAGAATIRVINPNQPPAIAQNAFMYLVAPPAPPPPPPPPVMISGVSPLSGPVSGGTQVTIDGQSFAPNCQVKFEGTVAAILSSSPARLIVTSPPGAAGAATIRVINPNQPPAIAQNAFMYLVAPPPPPPPPVMITGVSPLSGPVSGGTQVTIDGQNFAPNCQVKFEGTVAAILSNTPSRLIVSTPPAAAGPATIRVINPNQAAVIAPNAFMYVAAAPPPPPPVAMISGVSPLSGPVSGGTQVTIDGQSFAANCQVKFEGTVAAILSNTPSRLIVSTPPAAAGPATIRVINPNQAPVVAPSSFNYVAAPPPPPPLAVTVSAPNGGEILQVGQTFNINWTSNSAVSHRVGYSIDGGQSFTPIVTNLPADARNFLWTVPALVPADRTDVQALVRVTAISVGGLEASDTSNAPFTVRKQSAGPLRVRPKPSVGRVVKRLAAGESVTFRGGFEVTQGDDGPRVATCVGLAINPKTRLPPGVSVRLEPARDDSPPCSDGQLLTCREGETGDCGDFTLKVNTTFSARPEENTPPGDYTIGVDDFCGLCLPQIASDFFTYRVAKPSVVLDVEQPSEFVFAGDKARYLVNVSRFFYTGPVIFEVVFSQPPTNITVLALDLPPTTDGNATQTRTVEIQTMAPRAEVTPGTTSGDYTVTIRARPPSLPPVAFDSLNVSLRVDLQPDADIAIVDPNEMTTMLGQGPVVVTYNGALFRYNFTGEIKLSVADKPQGATADFELGEMKEIEPNIWRIKFKLKLTIPPGVEARTYEMKAVASFMAPDKKGVPQPRVKMDKLTLKLRRLPAGRSAQLKITPSLKEVVQQARVSLQVAVIKSPDFEAERRVRLSVSSSSPLLETDIPSPVVFSFGQFAVGTTLDTPPGDYTVTVMGQALNLNDDEVDPSIPVLGDMATVRVQRKLPPIMVSFDVPSIDIMQGEMRKEVMLSINKGGAMGQLGFGFNALQPGELIVNRGKFTDTSLQLFITAPPTTRLGQGFLTIEVFAIDALTGITNPSLTINVLPPAPQPPQKPPRR